MFINSKAMPWYKRVIHLVEHGAKSPVFHCSMCGQCVLRSTGLVCPMRCPKQMRNGPCGGSMNGRCEVFPDRKCIWDMAWRRARFLDRLRVFRIVGVKNDFVPALPAVDWRLWGTPSWWHLLTGRIDSHGHAVPSKEEAATKGVGSAGKAEQGPTAKAEQKPVG